MPGGSEKHTYQCPDCGWEGKGYNAFHAHQRRCEVRHPAKPTPNSSQPDELERFYKEIERLKGIFEEILDMRAENQRLKALVASWAEIAGHIQEVSEGKLRS